MSTSTVTMGAGHSESNQTGWAWLVAKLIQVLEFLDPQRMLEAGRRATFIRERSERKVKK